MNKWKKALKKNPNTKYLINWEHEQKVGYIALGIIIGSVSVGVIYFTLVWTMK